MDKVDPTCKCTHHAIAPVAIVLIGLDFLGHAAGLISDTFLSLSWPALLVIAGLVKLAGHDCRCCAKRA
ncbi:MAG TPA: hypothetical protein VEB18_02175 [Candidatus Paceibacterota bacterium]|nr:hypothetical protein [Candidatus Paceibacterota bacterium]